MASVLKNQNLINCKVDGAALKAGLDVTPNTAAGVTQTPLAGVIRRVKLKLTAVAVSVTAALDYGSVKLVDLPNGNLLFLGGIADLTYTSTGIDTSAANVDMAVGTAAASNATLSGTMLNLIPKIDSTAGSVVKGASTSTEAAKVFATSNTDVFLNVAAATTIDGSVAVSGEVELFYLDLGDQA